jgi:hypothetical protein
MFYATPHLDFVRIGSLIFEGVSTRYTSKLIKRASRAHNDRACEGLFLQFRDKFPESLHRLHDRHMEGSSDPTIWPDLLETLENLIALEILETGLAPIAPHDAVYFGHCRAVWPEEAMPKNPDSYIDTNRFPPLSYVLGVCIFYGALCDHC